MRASAQGADRAFGMAEAWPVWWEARIGDEDENSTVHSSLSNWLMYKPTVRPCRSRVTLVALS